MESVYIVTMTEGELKLFSEFLEHRNYSGLSKDEKETLEELRYLTPKEKERVRKSMTGEKVYRGLVKDAIEENGSTSKPLRTVGFLGGATGGMITAVNKELPSRTTTLAGALVGSALGSGVGAVVDNVRINREVRHYKEDPNNPIYKDLNNSVNKYNDLIDVSDNKMTEKEFIKKWHPSKKKKKK